MITRLYYVRCDGCGAPCGGIHDLTESVAAARKIAARKGWTRVGRKDRCIACKPAVTRHG